MNTHLGTGIKTFQELANNKGHYGSIMFQGKPDSKSDIEAFQNTRKQRISPANAMSEDASIGVETINVVASAALFTDPDVSDFANSLCMQAMLAASEQLENNDGKERFCGAFEIHTLKTENPTMHFYIFFREKVEGRIRQLHKHLKQGTLPGMNKFADSGIEVGKSGLTRPYSRSGPGGKPFFHGNRGDGEGGFDPNRDWKGYKVPITLPDKPQFGDYRDGNPALSTHLDKAASIPLSEFAPLLIDLEIPDLDTLERNRLTNHLKNHTGDLDALAERFAQEGHDDRALVAKLTNRLLNINTIHDVQKTNSAEFWRTFKA